MRWPHFALPLALLLVNRLPLHRATYDLPVSNDDAIPLLMARHIARGELATILWNQPYNGALDAYLLAPGLWLAPPHATFRAYEAACAVLLITAVALIASRLGGAAAALGAALLAAAGTPYMSLMAATGPPPNFLIPLLVCVPLLVALRGLDRSPFRGWEVVVSGLVGGLAVWDSALALPSLGGVGLGLWLAGLRPRPAGIGLFALGLAVGACPLLAARWVGASGASPVTALRPTWLWADGIADLGRAVAGLIGLEVPLVVDGPEREPLPPGLGAALAAALALLVAAGCSSRRALPLLGWAAALAATFALSRRTGADEVRYLYGLLVPVLTLAGAGLARVWHRSKVAAFALAAVVLLCWGVGHRLLLRHWRQPRHAAAVWQVPPLEPVLSTLRRAGVRSAYASLQFAGRLNLESGGEVIASQAWNERIPGDPLRFRDEVDLDPAPAWVLSPHLSRGMPRAGGFRELLGALGGGWREDRPGDLVIFRRFVPPYDEARPVPVAALSAATIAGGALPAQVFDRDVSTVWTSPLGIARGSGLAVRLRPPRRLSALVLALDIERSPLAVPWICEADALVVASGPARHGLQWVNGAPRAGKQGLMVVALPADRPLSEVRILFQDAGPPLTLSEVLAYGPDEPAVPDAGAAAAAQALDRARVGDWEQAARLYGEAAVAAPHRASYHAGRQRARWRAVHRQRLDVESLDDGGPALVQPRPGP